MEENKKLFLKDHWFWGTIFQNSGIYSQVFSASIFINVFRSTQQIITQDNPDLVNIKDNYLALLQQIHDDIDR